MALGAINVADAAPAAVGKSGPTRARFRSELARTVRADHPAILPVAEAIRAVTTEPIEQLIVVDRVTRLLVEYDSDRRVYAKNDYHATLDEMVKMRDLNGWAYLRDDCDGRAVFAAHLLAALEIPWRLETSYWKRHAWVSAVVAGVRYDLLDVQPGDRELQALSYRAFGRLVTRASRPPPAFAWRTAWRERTEADIELGIRLGLLEGTSRPGQPQRRQAVNWTNRNPHLRPAVEANERLAASPVSGY